MTVTVQQVIDLALITLGDSPEVTWTDATRLEFAKTAIDLAYKRAPHLFIGSYPFAGATTFTVASAIPFEDKYARPISYGVIAMSHGMDDEYAVNGVAAGWMQMFDREFPP
jgi:hypothetical protein